jgi:hypothetical protein
VPSEYMSIWVFVDKILKYKEIKFSVSSDYIILLSYVFIWQNIHLKVVVSYGRNMSICGYKIY